MVFMQYGGLLAVRNRHVSIINSNPLWGPQRFLAVPAGMLATALIGVTNLYGPGLQRVFATTPIPSKFWGIPFGLALGILMMHITKHKTKTTDFFVSRNTAMAPLTRVKRLYSHYVFCATNLCSTQVRQTESSFLKNPPLTLGFYSGSPAKNEEEQQPMEESFISCCFSFTIRRDKWGIPSMIVGNFIQC